LMLPYPGSPSLNMPMRAFLVCWLLHVIAAVICMHLVAVHAVEESPYLFVY
jgi:hypothetical protein